MFRNQDFQEVTLEKDNKVFLRFAIANGFKNIQNLVQKLKRNKCTYDYVEIMACPSGQCILFIFIIINILRLLFENFSSVDTLKFFKNVFFTHTHTCIYKLYHMYI